MNAHHFDCRIVHRSALRPDDRLRLLVSLLNWAEAHQLMLRQFQSRFSPTGEFSFTVQTRDLRVIDDLLAVLPAHAVGEVYVNGSPKKLPPKEDGVA